MEQSLRDNLEDVEKQLLILGIEIEELLKKQEDLLQKKELLQAQLNSLSQNEAGTSGEHLDSTDWENGKFEWSEKLLSLLTSHFKLNSFRPLQTSTINATLSGKDVILIMPTGGGKSLCYQLPCYVEAGLCVVVSPLVSLMEDQLMSMKKLGIRAAMLSANCTRTHVNEVHVAMTTKGGGDSDLKVLYVTPEKLSKSKRFMSRLEKTYEMGRLARIVIDEIHCASQWGHDFRPDYKILGILKRQFPATPILGLTATATPRVLTDCRKILSLETCLVFRASYNRANLFYEVRPKPSSQKAQVEAIAELIKTKFHKQSGIVYCLSRNNAEEVCRELCRKGISAGCYHADCLPGDRTRVHTEWLNNTLQVIVATIAFGMGIDKADVRFVIHHSLSKSMENYYQESGRAGRDGNPAHCIIFYRATDAFRHSSMVFTDHTGLENLHSMMKYCINGVKCRRSLIAESFGESWREGDCSSACDVCVKLNSGHCSTSSDSTSATIYYELQVIDISNYVKNLVLIIEHSTARNKRLTAAKLVGAWRETRQTGFSRPASVPATDKTIEVCERIIVRALLEGVLCEEFHYTAYTTICYIGLGRKAELAKKGLLQLELSSLVLTRGEGKRKYISKSTMKRKEATPTNSDADVLSNTNTPKKSPTTNSGDLRTERETECVSVSPSRVSTATGSRGNLLPSMILTEEETSKNSLLMEPQVQLSRKETVTKRQRMRQRQNVDSSFQDGVVETRHSGEVHVRHPKGKKRKCSSIELPDSQFKRLHHDDVIEIDDDSD